MESNSRLFRRRKSQRYIALLLIVSMIFETFAGCGKADGNNRGNASVGDASCVSSASSSDAEYSNNRDITADTMYAVASSNDAVAEFDDKAESKILNIQEAVEKEDYNAAISLIGDLETMDSEYEESVSLIKETYAKAEEDLSDKLSAENMEVFKEREKNFFVSLEQSKNDYDSLVAEIKKSVTDEDKELAYTKLTELNDMLYPQNEVYGGNVEEVIRTDYKIGNDVIGNKSLSYEDPSLLDTSGAVALSEELKSIAERLGSPLEVYNFLKNSINYSNYSGLRKGAVATYDSRRGNDVDQATLLVGMLRYLGYPAGYKTGYIKLDEETALNLTGASNLRAAADILAAMGEKVALVSVKGKPTYIKKEHTWVSTYVPFTDYRGSGYASGEKVWVDLDTSIKKYDDAVGIYDSFEKYYSTDYGKLSEEITVESAEMLYDGLEDYYDGAEKFYTEDAVKNNINLACGSTVIRQHHEKYLPLSLQYEIVSNSEVYASVENSSDTITLMFDWDDDITIKSYELYCKRLTIEYEGASDYERSMIKACGNIMNLVPGEYFVVPVLKMDGKEILRGPETKLGNKQALTILVSSGIQSRSTVNNMTAGSMYSIVTDLQTITYQQGVELRNDINAEIDKIDSRWASDYSYDENDEYNCDGFYSEDEMGLVLYQTGIYYFSKLDEYMILMAESDNVYANRFTSLGMTGYEVEVNSLFGNRVSLSPGKFITDIDFNNLSIVSLNGDDFGKLSYMLKMGTISSQMESVIWKDMFDVEAVSTIDIFNKAYKDNIEILVLDQSSINDSLNGLKINETSKKDIKDAVSQGYEVHIPKENVEICGKKWTGYIVLDPQNNSGRYMVTSGLSGAETISIEDIDMELAKIESDWYLNSQMMILPIVYIGALLCISKFGDSSPGKATGYFLMSMQAPYDILCVSYEKFKQDQLYEAYLAGDDESGIAFYNNMRSEAVAEFVTALGYLIDFIDILLDGRIADALAKRQLRRNAEKEAAKKASKGIARDIGGDFVEDEIEKEVGEEIAEEIVEKEAREKLSKESAEEVIEKEALEQEKEVVDSIADNEFEKAGCFVAGTLIKTDKGNKTIEEISVGDMVYSYNPLTGDTGYKKVRRLYIHDAYSLTKLTIAGEEVIATDNHPFYVEGYGFERADEVIVGDQLQKADGSPVKVEKTELIHSEFPVKVYNLEVEDWHTYYVMDEGVLVHNMCMRTPVEGNETLPTKPSLPKGSKPKGDYALEKNVGLKGQNHAADKLANEGYDIEMLKEINGGNGYGINERSNPDFLIEEHVFDCYTPDKGTPAKNISNTISKKTVAQCDRIVLNLENISDESVDVIMNYILERTAPDRDLKRLNELMVILPDGKIETWFLR